MNENELISIARRISARGKGLLAIDESSATCNRRFAAFDIAGTAPLRRACRDWMVGAPGLSASISAVILNDETINQHTLADVPFAQAVADAGMIPGVKVDMGLAPFHGDCGEQVTLGLDGLRERLARYHAMGARFAKWRAVVRVDENLPSHACVMANAHALARFAALCQEAGLVPVVEPEILMAGEHALLRSAAVSECVLRMVFAQLVEQEVLLEGLILKTSMVLPGLACVEQAEPALVAEMTVRSMRRAVPAAVAAIAFLSGGQTPAQATLRLNALQQGQGTQPWAMTFSFGRALQQPALALWQGHEDNVAAAQRALVYRASCNSQARCGRYHAADDAQATWDRAIA
ncbi:class I fructose-bisphosphate aldolase [Massilia sp. DWR3-1-1]|uniref:class I fructose-bisphosphate aldolase n=1 Tax=Massilia sp. DWR3-1-1 TaxID=2804559 RepID=UPI003CF9873D